MTSETESFVTFSSPNEEQAVAIYVAEDAPGLEYAAAANLAVFREEHPEAEVVAREEAVMNGKEGLLQQVRYGDSQQVGGRTLFVVTAINHGSAFSLWVLGPTESEAALKTLLTNTLRSIRFLPTAQ
jgi:hypothetical protein